MTQIFSSKFGIILASIYLLLVFAAVVDYAISPPVPMFEFALLILTAPVSFLVAFVFDYIGLLDSNSGSSLIYLFVAIGSVTNALILDAIGCLVMRFFRYIFSNKSLR